jgi:hypothetical protein
VLSTRDEAMLIMRRGGDDIASCNAAGGTPWGEWRGGEGGWVRHVKRRLARSGMLLEFSKPGVAKTERERRGQVTSGQALPHRTRHGHPLLIKSGPRAAAHGSPRRGKSPEAGQVHP